MNRLSKYSLELLCVLLAVMLLLAGCGVQDSDALWQEVTMEDAIKLMETEKDYVILDVRRADEYASGHIPGAVNLSNETISAAESADDEAVKAVLPDKDQLILVYCRSGNRSKQASQKLAEMGYTRVIEFGGILDWPGEIEH